MAWTWLSISDPSGTTRISTDIFQEQAILDSGSTALTVPSDLFAKVMTYFNAVHQNSDQALVRCDIALQPGTLDFGFGGTGGPIISVPFSQLVLPPSPPLTFADGVPACVLGVRPTLMNMEMSILGDTFLRSAYVVYDLDAQMIGLAPTRFNSTETNIVEITACSNNQTGKCKDSFVAAVSSAAIDLTITHSFTDKPGPVITASLDIGAPNGVVPTSIPSGVSPISGVKTSIALQTFTAA